MRKTILAFLVLALLLAGMAGAEDASSVAHDDTLTYAIDQDASTLTVTLLGNSTTGYEWTAQLSAEDVLTEESADYVPDEAAADTAGAGGAMVFVYKAADGSKGSVTLTFSYAREWEEAPIRVYEMDIAIDAAGLPAVVEVRRPVPLWAVGDTIACPDCGREDAVILEVVDGGDEEGGVVYFITIECPDCGTLEEMEF